MNNKDFTIRKGRNYSVLSTRDYGEIVFGCPPGIVKEFIKQKRPLPSKYIFPLNTFHNGQNNFDFEFIFYSFLFTRAQGNMVSAYCRPEQEKRFRKILNETLFGPRFDQLLEAQNHKILNRKDFNEKDRRNFKILLQKGIAQNKKLFNLFESNLKIHASETSIRKIIKVFFDNKIIPKQKWLLKKNIASLSTKLTGNYIQCAQLRKEFELFLLATEEKRDEFISQTIKFYHIDKSGTVYIKAEQNKHKKLKIFQVKSWEFEVFEGKLKRSHININHKISTPVSKSKNFIQPFFGVTFLGVGSGFCQNTENSSIVIWSEGKGILVDVVNKSRSHAAKYGINDNDINYIFLTHVHSDHDSGILEKILNFDQTYIISTHIIYESFLRKASAITGMPIKTIQGYCVFIEVEPKKKLKVPGFKNTYFEFDYSLHSIPTGRFKIIYAKGKMQKSIAHSGDTKYDFLKINRWYSEGAFTKRRKEKILGFIWDSDLVIHDVGGGLLHTNYEALLNFPTPVKSKIILVHQNDKPIHNAELRFAVEGETIALLP